MTEEQKLIDAILSAESNVSRIKHEAGVLRFNQSVAERILTEAEAAYIAFMDDCGIIKSKCGNYKTFIKESEQVDIASLDAVPDEYVRVKEVREPNKSLIKAMLPQANWYSIKKVRNLQIKMKG